MKEIAKVLTGRITASSFEEIGTELCEGCNQTVVLKEAPLMGGTNKGKKQVFRYGCKCEERQLAQEALEAQVRAKKAYALSLFDEKSLINEKLKQATLNNYEPRNESQINALKWACEYARTFNPKTSSNVLFQGSYGLGKSHISVGIVRYLIKQGHTCIFTSVPKLFTKIKATYDKDSGQKESHLLDALEIVDLLVLDDLGAEQASEWQISKFFEVVDTRAGKPTIFTTNHSAEHLLKQVGRRNFDRLFDHCEEIILTGESYRLKDRRNYV
jgi:DNA replication protein DnaC